MSDEDLPELARKIRDAIEQTGETQAEIARRAGINRDMMNRYVRGVTPPPIKKITAIAKALDIDPRQLDKRAPSIEELPRADFDLMISQKGDGMCNLKLHADFRSLEDAVKLSNEIRRMMEKYR